MSSADQNRNPISGDYSKEEVWASRVFAEVMKRGGITQREMAALLGCTQPTVFRILRINAPPALGIWLKLVGALELPLPYLKRGSALPDPQLIAASMSPAEIRYRLRSQLRKVNEERHLGDPSVNQENLLWRDK